VIVPVVLPEKLAEHVATPPLPLKVQLVLPGEAPAPEAVRFTLPVGVVAGPPDVSLTVTVHELATLGRTGLAQLTAVEVVRLPTSTESAPELPTWFVSPAKVTDTLMVPWELGVSVNEQIAVVLGPFASVQVVLVGDTPAPLAVALTVPLAMTLGLGDVSDTVTSH
jgi:hypothetical protein